MECRPSTHTIFPALVVLALLASAASVKPGSRPSAEDSSVQACRYDAAVQLVLDHELESMKPMCQARDLGCLAYHIARNNWTALSLDQVDASTGSAASSEIDINDLSNSACLGPLEDRRPMPIKEASPGKHIVVLQRMFKSSSSSLTCIASLLGPISGHAYVDLFDRYDADTRKLSRSMSDHSERTAVILREWLRDIDAAEDNRLEGALLTGGHQNRFIVSGHIPFVPFTGSSSVTWITMLRRPIQRLRSIYYWKVNERSHDPDLHLELDRRRAGGACGCSGDLDFEACLLSLAQAPSCRETLPFNHSVLLAESPVTMLCGTQQCLVPGRFPGVPSSSALVQAKDNMQNYLVGLTEEFDLSLGLFACELPHFFGLLLDSDYPSFPPRRRWVSKTNTHFIKNKQEYHQRSDTDQVVDLVLSELPAFKLLLERENALYDEGKRRFERDLERSNFLGSTCGNFYKEHAAGIARIEAS